MLNPGLKYLPIKDSSGNIIEWKQSIFLKNFITKNFIEVGDYTYYDASFTSENPEDFENTNVLYFPTNNSKLKIGKFCSLANKCKFMMSGAQHPLNTLTTYPLFWNFIFDPNMKDYFATLPDQKHYHKQYGDTVLGNDIWIGYDALIMPGIKIGDGAVVGARAVVTKDVPPYTIVAGNPAKTLRQRFADQTIIKLLELKWWDLPIEVIMEVYPDIMNCNLENLQKKLAKHNKNEG